MLLEIKTNFKYLCEFTVVQITLPCIVAKSFRNGVVCYFDFKINFENSLENLPNVEVKMFYNS